MRIGILVPHIFAQQKLLDKVIFAPVHLAIELADHLSSGHEVTLFTPGSIDTEARNVNVDLALIEEEAQKEGCTIPELIMKNPLSFVSLSRLVQAELSAKAFEMCKAGEFDVLHVFMCESEVPLYFSNLVDIPVVFTHHDPYNFYRKYRASFPKLRNLNYVSITYAQRDTAPAKLNFVSNVYNAVDIGDFDFNEEPGDYFAYIGRIIRVKGCHIAIDACKNTGLPLRIAGKYYTSSGEPESDYWSNYIEPHIDEKQIIYEGFISDKKKRSEFLGGAKALLFPIEWDEPFGMVIVEALACGTPVIAFDRGPVEEILEDGTTGLVVKNQKEMEDAMRKIDGIGRKTCREHVEKRFTIDRMVKGYIEIYKSLTK